jgi:hypothetical protein
MTKKNDVPEGLTSEVEHGLEAVDLAAPTAPAKRFLRAEDILDAPDIKVEELEVPEWGGTLCIRTLTADEMAAFVDKYGKEKNRGDAVVKALQLSAVDPEGNHLFPQDDGPGAAAILAKLRKKSLRAYMRVQSAVLRLNGMTDEEQKTAKND